jgi:hypothetical protein
MASQVEQPPMVAYQQQQQQQQQQMMNNPVLHTAPHQWTTNMTASSLTSASTGISCLDEQIERLKRCEYLREGEVKALCLRAREILVDESNVQRVDAPVTVGPLLCVYMCLCATGYIELRGRISNKSKQNNFSLTLFHLPMLSRNNPGVPLLLRFLLLLFQQFILHPKRFVVIYMVNFMTWWNCSRWVENVRIRIIYFWVTLWIVDITV